MEKTNKMNTVNNETNNEKAIKAAERAAKAAERLAKANERVNAAKIYTESKTGYLSESLRESKAARIAAFTIDDLASACVKRAKELMTTRIPKDFMRWLKAEVANCVKAQIGDEKLALFIHCGLGCLKVDQAIRYACSASRNEDVKALVAEIKKTEKAEKKASK